MNHTGPPTLVPPALAGRAQPGCAAYDQQRPAPDRVFTPRLVWCSAHHGHYGPQQQQPQRDSQPGGGHARGEPAGNLSARHELRAVRVCRGTFENCG